MAGTTPLPLSYNPVEGSPATPPPDIAQKSDSKNAPPGRFEGYEKRLEIEFFPNEIAGNLGLRALNRSQLDEIAEAAKCRVISHISNQHMDLYLVSESSLIIYPYKIIIKTCGTTLLLGAIPVLFSYAHSIFSMKAKKLRYTCGSFLFPQDQHFPHRSFDEEIRYLNKFVDRYLPSSIPQAFVMQGCSDSNSDCWHIYNASATSDLDLDLDLDNCQPSYTIEICMTQLDPEKTSVFYKKNCESASEMSSKSGLSDVIPGFEIDAYNFEPCGYSMNGMKGRSFCSSHVTPQIEFSYASFEIAGYDPTELDGIQSLVSRVLHCFGPSVVSVAAYIDRKIQAPAAHIFPEGYKCESTIAADLLGDTLAIYQTYTKQESSFFSGLVPKCLHYPCDILKKLLCLVVSAALVVFVSQNTGD